MSAYLLFSVLLVVVAGAFGGLGIWGIQNQRFRMLGVLLLLGFVTTMFVALPWTFEHVTEEGYVVDVISFITDNLLRMAPFVFGVVIVLTVIATVLLFVPTIDVDVIHARRGTHPHVQWVWGTLAIFLIIGEIMWATWLYNSQKNERIAELVSAGQLYDAVTGTTTFNAKYSRTGRQFAAIQIPVDYLDKARLQSTIESKVKNLPNNDEWKDLTVKKINAADYFSSDGRTITHLTVHFDGELKANAAMGRTAVEPVANGSVRIESNESDIDSKLEELTEKILTKVEKLSPGSTRKSGTRQQRNRFRGNDLFPSSSPFSR